ncbi:Putative aliphatic sulfonates transport permease protein SsuC [Pelagimonas phthalicica]|uniref:Putative aliphatic sulfonates transport permease protein SsuC n=1 Tax=Pelagimonas phthalicica TaxID=1037362 RepID=A0A238JFV5_9RHOB|nr:MULTISPECIES: ABC transporter permease [Roseobacteraceae]MBO9467455.1 ABC transporter permease [Tropicibacter sp. R15_0]TDS92034.1 NitT/TauT family transport system permease protein [Pelagimonas phthalicica]SMX29084.1 Putative aliphatic sulfonates transport permease protein SsuC [Pelagimonas phthalicica]
MKSIFPILTVVAAIFALWYVFAVVLNAPWAYSKAERAEVELSFSEMVADTMAQEKPRLPAPHQVGAEIWKTTVEKKITSKRSLIYHGWITLQATALGFAFGIGLGILLAVSIVHFRVMDMSVMPWIIASQTVPILAIAPMIVVVLAALQVDDIVAKGVISMYLSFFPVVVGMVKGLRSPDTMLLDQMKTYSASSSQTFWKLRLPASAPYLFASLKVGAAASLIGAVVAELSLSQNGGLGARLLAGSYYGQTIQIWSALLAAATLAALMVFVLGAIEKVTLKRMGMAQ